MPGSVIMYVSKSLEILWLMYVILALINLFIILGYSTIINQNFPLITLLISNPIISNNLSLKHVTLILTLKL
jgi:hypothetical protein